MSSTTPSDSRGPFETTLLALRVLVDEGKRLALDGFRAWEIRRLQRRLDEEYQKLGRLNFEATEGAAEDASSVKPSDAVSLSKDTIMFLRKEIEYLESSRARLSAEVVKERIARYNLDS